MNISFPLLNLHYSMHLQFKLAFFEKNQQNEINKKYSKKSEKVPNLNMYFKVQ